MIFTTLGGNEIPLGLAPYKIKWKAASLSKFQTRIKKFFCDHYSHLEWYEEVPLCGKDINRLRWDFLCVFEDKKEEKQKVFIEVDGNQHSIFSKHFHGTMEKFEDQLTRDGLKELFAAKNSKFPIIRFFEDDPELTIKWFEKTYPNILPRKNS
jgi:hypothetical protein